MIFQRQNTKTQLSHATEPFIDFQNIAQHKPFINYINHINYYLTNSQKCTVKTESL